MQQAQESKKAFIRFMVGLRYWCKKWYPLSQTGRKLIKSRFFRTDLKSFIICQTLNFGTCISFYKLFLYWFAPSISILQMRPPGNPDVPSSFNNNSLLDSTLKLQLHLIWVSIMLKLMIRIVTLHSAIEVHSI